MKTATFIRSLGTENWRGDARLYKLSEPIEWTRYDDEGNEVVMQSDFVAVSASRTDSGPETYIFPANKNGKVLSWLELGGSFRGELNHARALLNAGYTII